MMLYFCEYLILFQLCQRFKKAYLVGLIAAMAIARKNRL